MPEIPLVPSSGADVWPPDLARLLAGDDRSSSALSLLVRRASMFIYQPLDVVEKRSWGLFYERLRNVGEVALATVASWQILSAGVEQHHGVLINVDIEMFPSFFDAQEGRVPLPSPGETSCGNHQVVLIGADFESSIYGFDHLFSKDWGRDGQGGLSFEYVQEHAIGAIAIRSHGGPDPAEIVPATTGLVEGQSDDEDQDGVPRHMDRVEHLISDYREDAPESKWLLQHEDDDVIWMGRRLIGAGSGDAWIQGALLVRGVADKPLLVGWMFCRVVSDDLLDVEEFFIWPPYRSQGLGTALAGRTLLYAAATGAKRVRWLELSDDAIVNQRVDTTVPTWASDLEWVEPDGLIGWGVSRMTRKIHLAPLLARLGDLHVSGGVHLLWTDGTVHVSDHHTEPKYGIALESDVPKPPGVDHAESSTIYVSRPSRPHE